MFSNTGSPDRFDPFDVLWSRYLGSQVHHVNTVQVKIKNGLVRLKVTLTPVGPLWVSNVKSKPFYT